MCLDEPANWIWSQVVARHPGTPLARLIPELVEADAERREEILDGCGGDFSPAGIAILRDMMRTYPPSPE
jgi:hypothetical protein